MVTGTRRIVGGTFSAATGVRFFLLRAVTMQTVAIAASSATAPTAPPTTPQGTEFPPHPPPSHVDPIVLSFLSPVAVVASCGGGTSGSEAATALGVSGGLTGGVSSGWGSAGSEAAAKAAYRSCSCIRWHASVCRSVCTCGGQRTSKARSNFEL